MKKLSYLLLIFFFYGNLSVQAVELDIKSQNAILINLDENKVLYEKNSEEETPMASLTKLMTAIVVVENTDSLESKVTVRSSDFTGLAEANAAVAGFRIGQSVTIRDLLYGLLLPSGADAANTLTRIVAGDTKSFVNLMNEKVKSLGLSHTHFENTTGLDAENHYSTAKEMAQIFEVALENPELKQILTTERYTMSDSSFSVFSTVQKKITQNGLGLSYILGGKTGTTENAGLCLASIASYNSTNYLLVTINAPQEGKKPNNFYDAQTIYDYFIENYESQTLLKKGEEILTLYPEYTKEEQVTYTLQEPIVKYVPKNYQKEDIKIEYQEATKLKVNTKEQTILGKVLVSYQNEIIKEIPILLETSLHFDFVKYIQKNWIITALCTIIILIIIRILYIAHKKRKRRKLKRKNNQKKTMRR